MSERWGDSRRDREALDAHITRADDDDEIAGGMMEWVPGTLSDMVVERIGTDALADVWNNCGRDTAVFQEKLAAIVYAATGVRMSVYNGPRAQNYDGPVVVQGGILRPST